MGMMRMTRQEALDLHPNTVLHYMGFAQAAEEMGRERMMQERAKADQETRLGNRRKQFRQFVGSN